MFYRTICNVLLAVFTMSVYLFTVQVVAFAVPKGNKAGTQWVISTWPAGEYVNVNDIVCTVTAVGGSANKVSAAG